MNKDILLKIIEELYKVGYDVVATVSDMGPTNIGLWHTLWRTHHLSILFLIIMSMCLQTCLT